MVESSPIKHSELRAERSFSFSVPRTGDRSAKRSSWSCRMQRQDLRSKGSGLRRSATIVERSSRTLLIDTISNFPCARMRIHRSFAVLLCLRLLSRSSRLQPIQLVLHPEIGKELSPVTYPKFRDALPGAINETVPIFEGKFRITQDVTVSASKARDGLGGAVGRQDSFNSRGPSVSSLRSSSLLYA